MKKFIFVLALFGFMLSVNSAMAATNLYAPVNKSCDGGHAIYDFNGTVIEWCIPDADWRESQKFVDIKKFITMKKGQKILLKDGTTDYCPNWYPVGCMVKEELFEKFL